MTLPYSQPRNGKTDSTTRRSGVTEASGDRVTWSYDPTYQLTNERRSGVNSYNVTYSYDPAGNRLVKNDGTVRTTSTYDAANRLIYAQDNTGRTTFAFDATGNQKRQTTPAGQITTSLWDFENLNKAVIQPSLSRTTFVFNADKLRVEKDTASTTRKYVLDGRNILLETDGTGLSQAVYALEPKEFGKLISQRQLVAGSWVPVNYHFDGLGSTDSLSDGSAVITDTYTYYAFGQTRANTGTSTNLFKWVGELGYVADTETGEYSQHVRQQNPNQGRMKSADPLGPIPDPNVFRPVRNDPVNRVDPSGLEDSEPTLIRFENGETGPPMIGTASVCAMGDEWIGRPQPGIELRAAQIRNRTLRSRLTVSARRVKSRVARDST